MPFPSSSWPRLVALAVSLSPMAARAQEAEFVGVAPHTLLPPSPVAGNNFGSMVAAAGDSVVVTNQSATGAVAYLFRRDTTGPGAWGLSQTLVPPVPVGASRSPRLSVAMRDDWLALGAPDETGSQGAAYVYRRNASGTYDFERRFAAAAAWEQFGFTTAMNERFFLAGAPNTTVGGFAQRGAVYVYEKDTPMPGAWGFVQKLTSSHVPEWGMLGNSVALSDDLAIGGAPGGSVPNSAIAFKWNPMTRRFVETAAIDQPAACPPPDCFFARTTGTYKLDLFAGGQGTSPGGAVFHYVGAPGGTFSLERTLTGTVAGGALGTSVAVAPALVIASAPGEATNAGAAYLYYQHFPTRGTGWGQVARLTADTPRARAFFGGSVGLDQRVAVVGAPNDDRARPAGGVAFVFDLLFAYTPSFVSTPPLVAKVLSRYSYAAEACDNDAGDHLAISATTRPTWLTVTDHGDGTALVSGTPTWAGSYPVVLEVRDTTARRQTQAFTIVVR